VALHDDTMPRWLPRLQIREFYPDLRSPPKKPENYFQLFYTVFPAAQFAQANA
jgi:hypothetical protein